MKHTVSLALSLLLLLLLMWLPATAAQPYSGPVLGTHIVKLGETLYCIGRAYGVDPWAIAAHNVIANANIIQPGDVLQIPDVPATLPAGPVCQPQFALPGSGVGGMVASGECVCAVEHTVVTGETLAEIAVKYQVGMETIARCNGLRDLNYIRIADKLCIPAPAP